MKDFFELIVKEYHFPKMLASNFMIVFYCLTFILSIYKFIQFGINKYKKYTIKKIVDKDLHPYFIHREIYNYTKFYIPQYFQNITPSEGEEPGKIHAAAAKSKLMREFIDKGLLTQSPVKYFILLSDTGMGKTAFLINLYIRYKTSSIKIGKPKYNIKFFPLGSTDSLEKIKKLEDKTNTILLLDAFDEDIKAVADYKSRMIEILDNVKEFRKVIFTCRTQFFPNKDEEPMDTNDMTFGENYKHKIQKLYLSAFDDYDILKYLFKKFGFSLFNLFKSYRLVKKSPSLMFRPMLLSYINDLINEKIYYNYTFEMYKVLIDKWIKREAMKPAVSNRADRYTADLMRFSRTLAKNLYTEREKREGYFIRYDELQEMTTKQMFNTSSMTFDDKTGRSLLNRNSVGQFKFAHKSLLEYLLALEVFENPDFLKDFDFHGMDATENFHIEMLANLLTSIEGKYINKGDSIYKPMINVLPSQVKKIEKILILDTENLDFKKLSGLTHLKSLIITDKSFTEIYLIYLFICIEKRISKTKTNQVYIGTFNNYVIDFEDVINEINKLKPRLDYSLLKTLIEFSKIDETLKLKFNSLISPRRIKEPLSRNELDELKELKGIIIPKNYQNVRITNSILKIQQIEKLSKFVPKVELYF